MEVAKKYYHDKLILLLASSNVFLAFLTVVLIFLRLGQGGEGYIVEYRPKVGINAFVNGSILDILVFVAFTLVMTALVLFLSMRVYSIRRVLTIMILGSGIALLVLNLVVVNALLVLR